METSAEGPAIVVKLSDGEEMFPGLEETARQHRVDSGAVLWGIGMVQDFELGFFTKGGYVRKVFEDRHELLALHGSIAMRAEPRLHLHIAVAAPDHSVLGGHLFRAKACVVNEILISRFDRIRMNRQFNPGTGLRELVLESPAASGR